MYKCPTCGDELEIIRADTKPLTSRQRAIVDSIEVVTRDTQRETARIKDIATYLGRWSVRTIQREAHVLSEHLDVIEFPNGKKSGIALKQDVFVVRRARPKRAA